MPVLTSNTYKLVHPKVYILYSLLLEVGSEDLQGCVTDSQNKTTKLAMNNFCFDNYQNAIKNAFYTHNSLTHYYWPSSNSDMIVTRDVTRTHICGTFPYQNSENFFQYHRYRSQHL